ncbi:MAG: 50S ribosomal protein L15 [Chlamydiales bacterium]|nr:50S ribosomal protein L15 [Chlamydiales bacterium]
MTILSNLKNTHRPYKARKLLGRGVGSKKGKTCGKGHKGDKARSGYTRRYGQEGGQFPLYRKLPIRGFTNGRFKIDVFSINLGRIDMAFEDGETVSLASLKDKKMVPSSANVKLKILANGELTKKVLITANMFSKAAVEKLEKNSIEFKRV